MPDEHCLVGSGKWEGSKFTININNMNLRQVFFSLVTTSRKPTKATLSMASAPDDGWDEWADGDNAKDSPRTSGEPETKVEPPVSFSKKVRA